MDDIPSVENIVRNSIFIYDIELIDSAMVVELARWSIKKYEKNVQLIRHIRHIFYVDNNYAPFKAYRCAICDAYFQRTGILERHLQRVRCNERVKHFYSKNVYQLPEAFFDKLDSLDIQYTQDQKLFDDQAVFHSESICIMEKTSKTPRRQLRLVNMFQYQSWCLQI